MTELDAKAIRKNYQGVQKLKVEVHRFSSINIDELMDMQHDLYKRMRLLEETYTKYIGEYRKQNKSRKIRTS